MQASATYPFTVVAALAIDSPAPPAATVGVPYSFTFHAQGGAAPYSWTATGLAAGLMLSTAGVLSGTPAAAGDSTLTVVVTDAGGAMLTARLAR
jgi:hypothetical protein